MARLTALFTVLALGLALAAPPEWLCKKDLALLPDAPPPTDVAVDGQGHLFLLYGSDGFLDVYDQDGRLLQHRGGSAEEAHAPRAVVGQSLWVGRLGATALLVTDAAQSPLLRLLIPTNEGLKVERLRKPKDMFLNAPMALARDPQSYWYVWSGNTVAVFGPDGNYRTKVTLPPMRRPIQMAVDSKANLYCLEAGGLKVFSKTGQPKFDVAGAQAIYLTGADVLAAVGPNWVRRYGPSGRIELDLKEPSFLEGMTPAAISLNDQNGFYVYVRDGARGDGSILRLDAKGDVQQTFEQPVRMPNVPDTGFRLDFEGRLSYWTGQSSKLVKMHPGGKAERSQGYVADSDPLGRLLNPSELVVDGRGICWISDSGNSRLQRFSLAQGGWLKPIPIAIQGGDARGIPRALAITPAGTLLVAVHPVSQNGDVVLQTRSLTGELLSQRSLGTNRGNPVVKLASMPNGQLYVYRSLTGISPVQENPGLERFDERGNRIGALGPDGRVFHYPENATARVVLRPQEDLVPFGDGLLIAVQGRFLKVSPDFEVTDLATLTHPRGAKGGRLACEFGGAVLRNGVLYVTDTANRCLHRVPVPR